MALFDNRTGLEVIEHHDCLALLAAESIGRLAIIEGGEPLILPVNYVLDGESIVFRSGEGSKLSASRGGTGCFEIDDVDTERRSGWSVVVRGELEEITAYDGTTLDRLSGLVHSWVAGRSHLLRLQPWTITGRRIQSRLGDPQD